MGLTLSRYMHLKLIEVEEVRKQGLQHGTTNAIDTGLATTLVAGVGMRSQQVRRAATRVDRSSEIATVGVAPRAAAEMASQPMVAETELTVAKQYNRPPSTPHRLELPEYDAGGHPEAAERGNGLLPRHGGGADNNLLRQLPPAHAIPVSRPVSAPRRSTSRVSPAPGNDAYPREGDFDSPPPASSVMPAATHVAGVTTIHVQGAAGGAAVSPLSAGVVSPRTRDARLASRKPPLATPLIIGHDNAAAPTEKENGAPRPAHARPLKSLIDDDYYEAHERDSLESPFLAALRSGATAAAVAAISTVAAPAAASSSIVAGLSHPPGVGGVGAAPAPIIHWKKGELLGFGAYGHVYLGLNLENGQLMAVKQVPLYAGVRASRLSDLAVQALESEIAMMKHLPKHENIVAYLGTRREHEAAAQQSNGTDTAHLSHTGANSFSSESGGATATGSFAPSISRTTHTDDTMSSDGGAPDHGREGQVSQATPVSNTASSGPVVPGGSSAVDAHAAPEFLNIFLEYVPGGSIASLLRKFGRFNEGLVRIYVKQILQGLRFLHQHGIMHRDVKVRRRARDTRVRSV